MRDQHYPYAPCTVYLPTFKLTVNVGKYTIHATYFRHPVASLLSRSGTLEVSNQQKSVPLTGWVWLQKKIKKPSGSISGICCYDLVVFSSTQIQKDSPPKWWGLFVLMCDIFPWDSPKNHLKNKHKIWLNSEIPSLKLTANASENRMLGRARSYSGLAYFQLPC